MSRPRAAIAAAVIASGLLTGSPRPSAALDLPEALRQVAAASPTLAARQAMVEAARRRVIPSTAWFSPRVEVGVENVPVSGGFDTDPMTMKTIGIMQRLPLFGSEGLARDAAREVVTRESAAAAWTGYELLAMTWEAYAEARYAGERGAIAEAHVMLMDRLVQSARASESERRAAELDLRREVVAAHAELAAQGRTAVLLADTVITTLQRTIEASWTAYRAGTTDLWRVFESAHALYGHEIALARVRQARARAEARLIALTGRTDLLGVTLPAMRSER